MYRRGGVSPPVQKSCYFYKSIFRSYATGGAPRPYRTELSEFRSPNFIGLLFKLLFECFIYLIGNFGVALGV